MDENDPSKVFIDKSIVSRVNGLLNNFQKSYDEGNWQIMDDIKATDHCEVMNFLKSSHGNCKYTTLLGFFYQYKERNLELGFQCFEESAEQNDSYAQFLLGQCYELAIGTERDLEKSVYWYQQSAFNNNHAGRLCYSLGIGSMRDKEEALKYFMKAAESDNSYAQMRVAENYDEYFPGGGHKDQIKAVKWYSKAATRRPNAYFRLGFYYSDGKGTVHDMHTALKCFARAYSETECDDIFDVVDKMMNGCRCFYYEEHDFPNSIFLNLATENIQATLVKALGHENYSVKVTVLYQVKTILSPLYFKYFI
ncbi:13921_t:CDS:2 [Ambispora leptoticha]|uniref:13921_t:CDS:1 n=1 Tax=Ambispora leptoticha TaxID=144679 RepID=A0A9N8ZC32_9GLOM|nr:13921_t:CDS:2 [Ambispora leptoticha]